MSDNNPTEVSADDALALYKPPFRYRAGYIFDGTGKIFADEAGKDALTRVRGWGRIGYLPNPRQLQDKVGELIATALTQFWQNELDRKERLADRWS